jgi:hypothetical protein
VKRFAAELRARLNDAYSSPAKIGKPIFGAGFCRRGLAKILARICEATTGGSIGSQIMGNKPNKCEEV